MSWIDLLQQPMMRNSLAVSLGAIPGALSRYYLGIWFAQRFGADFPYGTFFINGTGCLVMGFFTTLALERVAAIPPEVRLMVAVGFLGSYTTFSTYGLDTANLMQTSRWGAALGYWLGSAVLGIVSLEVGRFLARALP